MKYRNMAWRECNVSLNDIIIRVYDYVSYVSSQHIIRRDEPSVPSLSDTCVLTRGAFERVYGYRRKMSRPPRTVKRHRGHCVVYGLVHINIRTVTDSESRVAVVRVLFFVFALVINLYVTRWEGFFFIRLGKWLSVLFVSELVSYVPRDVSSYDFNTPFPPNRANCRSHDHVLE